MQRLAFNILLCTILASFDTTSCTSSIANARASDPCQNLYESACTGGDRNDGTGLTVDSAMSSNHFSNFRTIVERDLTPEIAARLTNDNKFRMIASRALGTELSLTCHFALSFSKSCVDMLAAKTAKFIVEKESVDFSGAGLKDKYDLISSSVTKKLQQTADKNLRSLMSYDKKSGEIERMIKEIKELMIRRVEKFVSDPAKRELLVENIRKINNLPMSRRCGKGELSRLMTPSAFYEIQSNSMIVCPGMHLYTSSAYALSFIVAHEIAHSIGPSSYALLASKKFKKRIGTRNQFEADHPYATALECLRKVPKAGAEILAEAPAGYTYSKARMFAEFYHVTVLEKDEINETFADWLGIDVASEYLERTYPEVTVQQRRFGYANAIRNVCGAIKSSDNHRSGERRALTVATMPRVRKQMGCTDQVSTEASCGAGLIEGLSSQSEKSGSAK